MLLNTKSLKEKHTKTSTVNTARLRSIDQRNTSRCSQNEPSLFEIAFLIKSILNSLSLGGRGSRYCSESFFISSSTSFSPFLKLVTPLPRPRINSGIFFPPKIRRITKVMRIISGAPNENSNTLLIMMFLVFPVLCYCQRCKVSFFL